MIYRLLLIVSAIATFLNSFELNSFDDFESRCKKITITFKGKIKDFGKNQQDAIKNIKKDAIFEVTKQYYGVLVKYQNIQNTQEIIINQKLNRTDKNSLYTAISTSGLIFYEFKKYMDEDGDMLDYKVNDDTIKLTIKLDCSKNSYLNIKKYILQQSIKND